MSRSGSWKALLWDVDGTLAETELQGHRLAFNAAFAEAGLPWHWDVDTYLQLLRISGGRERMRRFSQERGQALDDAHIERLQQRKQFHYESLVSRGAVELRAGVARLITEASQAGLQQAIVTTSGRAAVKALTDASDAGLGEAFSFWICGEDVARKKPDPLAYAMAIERLGLDPSEILVIEDSRNGLQAATGAGLSCLVTLSASSRAEGGPDGTRGFETALAVLDGLGTADQPLRCHRGPTCPSGLVTLSWLQRLSEAP